MSTFVKDAIFTKNGGIFEIGRNLDGSLLQTLLKFPAILSRPVSEFVKRILKRGCVACFVLQLQLSAFGAVRKEIFLAFLDA